MQGPHSRSMVILFPTFPYQEGYVSVTIIGEEGEQLSPSTRFPWRHDTSSEAVATIIRTMIVRELVKAPRPSQ